MRTQKVTAAALRAYRIGESRTYTGMTGEEIESAKSIAYRIGRLTRTRFSARSDFENHTLTLTRLEQE